MNLISPRLFLAFGTGLLMTLSSPAVSLPHPKEYQKVIRNYLGTLTEADFTIRPGALHQPDPADEEQGLKDWLFSVDAAYGQPFAAALVSPSSTFLLSTIEGAETVMRPSIRSYVEQLACLAAWNPREVFPEPRPLRLRAFVQAAVDMLMLDEAHAKEKGLRRSDYLGGTLLWMSDAYATAKSDLPEPVRQAYETGLREMAAKIIEWGPTGIQTDMDLFAPISLRKTAKALNDPGLENAAKEYTEKLYAELFDPAGYFVDEHCFDSSYNGISLNFATWSAMQSPDWDFVRTALKKAYRIKAHLSLPEPPASRNALNKPLYYGPSHYNSRTSSDSANDQWNYAYRNFSAATFSDDALPFAKIPDSEELDIARRKVTACLESALAASGEAPSEPWRECHWTARNYAMDYLPAGTYARLKKLSDEESPLLKLPFERPGSFVENFADKLVVAKFERYGTVLFAGQVGEEYEGKPRGFGGGNLSAFWTPETGSVLLGRRRGANTEERSDRPKEWRNLPIHAISGQTRNGKHFNSLRCREPKKQIHVTKDSAEVTVNGTMASFPQNHSLHGQIDYSRTFKATAEGVEVSSSVTIVKGDARDDIAELYEIIPFFIRDARYQRAEDNTIPSFGIQFKVGDRWQEGSPEPVENVSAVRVERHFGMIEIVMEKPSRIRLSPEEWHDGYQTEAICRNVLIDLSIPGGPGEVFSTGVRYRVVPGSQR